MRKIKLAEASFVVFMLYEEFGELGPEFRLPADIKNLTRPEDYPEDHYELPPEALPLHGLMVQRYMGDWKDAEERWQPYQNALYQLNFLVKEMTGADAVGPLIGVGYFSELKHPPPSWRPDEEPLIALNFCLSGFIVPEIGLYYSIRGPHDRNCAGYGPFFYEDPDRVLSDFKPLDQSSPWVRSMLRHLRATTWKNTSIVHEDRMVDTSLDPPQASRFGEWWEEEFHIRPPRYIYHITYPAEIAQIRDSGVLLPYRGYARLTWCPEQMVSNTFGASRFIRIPVEDIPPGLINVTYDEEFVMKHPEIAETISEYVWDIDRDKLTDPSFVLKMAAEISRYSSECEAVYPGPFPLPPTTEWGIPAIGPMGLLFGES